MQNSLRLFVGGLTFSLACFALASPTSAARPERTTIKDVEPGTVCFPDDVCVRVGSASGALNEGPNPRSEWITEVRDDNGKVTIRVRPGGEILVLSPQAIAKRDAGQSTFTIERIDRSTRPIRTNLTYIQSTMMRRTFDHWSSFGKATFGSTALPPREGALITRNAWKASGTVTGISPAGEVMGSVSDALAVFEYSDYWVVLHTDGQQMTVTDARFQTLTPRLTNLVAFYPPYDEYNAWTPGRRYASNPENRQVVFAYETAKTGDGQALYQVLPRRAGTVQPANLMGLLPLTLDFSPACGNLVRQICRTGLPGWGAVWSTDTGPQFSIANLEATEFDTRRYKSLRWVRYFPRTGGIAEELTGGYRLLTTQIENNGSITFSHSLERYSQPGQVENQVRVAGAQDMARVHAALEADRALERARYAAAQAERAAQERERQARAAAEGAEFAKAQALIASNDANAICAGVFSIQSVHGRNNLSAACTRLRGGPQVSSRGFWGDLAAGLAAYNAGAYGSVASSGSSYASSSGSGSNSGEFNRSMQALDRNIRAIGDPNWNGSAASAQRY